MLPSYTLEGYTPDKIVIWLYHSFHSGRGRDREGGEGRSHTIAPSPICPFLPSPTPARASVLCERLPSKRVTVGPYSPLPISNSRTVPAVLTRHLQSLPITCRARQFPPLLYFFFKLCESSLSISALFLINISRKYRHSHNAIGHGIPFLGFVSTIECSALLLPCVEVYVG